MQLEENHIKTIIAGSRSLTNLEYVNIATMLSGFNITEVVSGMAMGIDTLGEEWADNNSLPISYYPANWKKYVKYAGFRRNEEMGNYADNLVAIWNGVSGGTLHMLRYMKTLNKPTFLYNPYKPTCLEFIYD